jgi:hypothetical protein
MRTSWISKRWQFRSIAVLLAIFASVLVAGACKRHVVKYGGPPADVSKQRDSVMRAEQESAQKSDSIVKLQENQP